MCTQKQPAVSNIPRTCLNLILHKDIYLQRYKVLNIQALKSSDHAKRRQFADQMMKKLSSLNNIFFAEDAHFDLNVRFKDKIADTRMI